MEVFEVWHYENIEKYNQDTGSGGLFTDYVNTFMQLKQVRWYLQ